MPTDRIYKIPDILPFRARLDELDSQMAEPDFYAGQQRAAEVYQPKPSFQCHLHLILELVVAFQRILCYADACRYHHRIGRTIVSGSESILSVSPVPNLSHVVSRKIIEAY